MFLPNRTSRPSRHPFPLSQHNSDCDTPIALINATLDWLAASLHDEVDFVVWTGDSARHDIDLAFPRSMPEIFNLNRHLSTRMREIFGKHVPIIPSFGECGVLLRARVAGGPPGDGWRSVRRDGWLTSVGCDAGNNDIYPHNIMFGGEP